MYIRSESARPILIFNRSQNCRYIFTADGKYLLGGMMVGDTSDYVKLVSLVKKKVHSTNIASVTLLLT